MMTARQWTLSDMAATIALGHELGKQIAAHPDGLRVVLFYGDLGTGKTTLTRGLISALPGGENAEVSSPSFNLCNKYPTTPPVLHCDLYRQEGMLPDEIDEALEATEELVLMEWSERIPAGALCEGYLAERLAERLDILLEVGNDGRLATLTPYGDAARHLVECLSLRSEQG